MNSLPQCHAPFKRMHILFANIWCLNPRLPEALLRLQAENADVVVLAELPECDVELAAETFKAYPHQQVIVPNSVGSLAVYSKFPITQFEELRFGLLANRPQGRFTIDYQGGFELFAVHTSAPFTVPNRNRRNRQIEKLAELIKAESKPVIAVGDFNCSHRSKALRPLTENIDLHEGRTGQKIAPSWPAGFCFWSIDHIFHSHHFEVQSFEVGRFIYSDHRPISTHLSLPDPQ